jgi:putative acyl-CoA dehydrogenase
MQAALLQRHAPSPVADGFIASRLVEGAFTGAAFGTLPSGVEARAIVQRAGR